MYTECNQLINETDQYFEAQGLVKVELPGDCLFSSYNTPTGKKVVDSSVDFIGSNTNIPGIKKMILSRNLEPNGIVTNSSKLRTQNTPSWFNPEDSIAYSSAFNSFGLTFPAEATISDVHDLIVNYLHDKFEIDKDSIVVTGDNSELISIFSQNGSATKFIANSNRFKWKFGVRNDDQSERLTGTGVAFEIEKDGELSGDLGTFELMYDNGELAAMEFGLGYQTSLARIQSNHPVVHTESWHLLNQSEIGLSETQPNIKAADALGVALGVLRSYHAAGLESIGSHKKGKELLSQTAKSIKINSSDTQSFVEVLNELKQTDNLNSSTILEHYCKRFV